LSRPPRPSPSSLRGGRPLARPPRRPCRPPDGILTRQSPAAGRRSRAVGRRRSVPVAEGCGCCLRRSGGATAGGDAALECSLTAFELSPGNEISTAASTSIYKSLPSLYTAASALFYNSLPLRFTAASTSVYNFQLQLYTAASAPLHTSLPPLYTAARLHSILPCCYSVKQRPIHSIHPHHTTFISRMT